jgi:ribulose bisphosphate carboxylase small subunit
MRKLANGRQGFDVNAGGSEVVEGRDEEPAAKQVRYIDRRPFNPGFGHNEKRHPGSLYSFLEHE